MFHCGICGNVSEPGEWPEMVVLQKRRVTYNIKREFQGKVRLPKFIKTKEIPVEVEKKGWEIVKEVPACSVCAAKPTRVQTVDPPIVRLIKETIVDTRKEIDPSRNFRIIASFSSGFMRPCKRPIWNSEKTLRRVSAICVAAKRSSFSDSSTRG